MQTTIRERQLRRIIGGKKMSKTNTNKRKDRSIFRRTAAGTKKINIAPKVMRGGTRL